MKKHLAAASFVAMSVSAGPATSLELYSFMQDGWSDNGVLSGRFVAEDRDGNGQINSFLGEVTDFSASYTSNTFETPVPLFLGFGLGQEIIFESIDREIGLGGFDQEVTFEGFGGLVFTLDGLTEPGQTRQLGDDRVGAVEGLAAFNFIEGLDIAVGPGPFELCDGENVCGGLFERAELTVSIAEENRQETPMNSSTIQSTQMTEEEFGSIADTKNAITVTLEELDGQLETDPVLPNVIGGSFVFDLDDIRFIPREIFFIDPDIAIGYTYEITGDTFFSVQAPSLDAVNDGDGKYLLTYEQGITVFEETLDAGQLFNFGGGGVTSFTITGIDPALGLSPTNTNAFVTGVAITGLGQGGQITQTPITVNAVPLPASGVLLLSGIAGFAFMRRRREALRG